MVVIEIMQHVVEKILEKQTELMTGIMAGDGLPVMAHEGMPFMDHGHASLVFCADGRLQKRMTPITRGI